MSRFFYDEELALAYKIGPVVANVVEGEDGGPKTILVHTNVKVTNYKREKVRRTVSEVYPFDQYTEETSIEKFEKTVLAKLLGSATPITQDEYDRIKKRVEPEMPSACGS